MLLKTLVPIVAAAEIKVGILSDIHLKLDYNPDSSANYCSNPTTLWESLFSSMKRWVYAEPKAVLAQLRPERQSWPYRMSVAVASGELQASIGELQIPSVCS